MQTVCGIFMTQVYPILFMVQKIGVQLLQTVAGQSCALAAEHKWGPQQLCLQLCSLVRTLTG